MVGVQGKEELLKEMVCTARMQEDCTLGNHGLGVYGWEKAKNEIVRKIAGEEAK